MVWTSCSASHDILVISSAAGSSVQCNYHARLYVALYNRLLSRKSVSMYQCTFNQTNRLNGLSVNRTHLWGTGLTQVWSYFLTSIPWQPNCLEVPSNTRPGKKLPADPICIFWIPFNPQKRTLTRFFFGGFRTSFIISSRTPSRLELFPLSLSKWYKIAFVFWNECSPFHFNIPLAGLPVL